MNRAFFTQTQTCMDKNQHASSPAKAGQAIQTKKTNFIRMKNIHFLSFKFFFLLIIPALFISCEEEDVPKGRDIISSIYVVDYGVYHGVPTSISSFNPEKDTIIQNVYHTANGVLLNSNVQHMAIHDGKAYLMSNDGDKVDIVDATTFKAIGNPVREDIIKPRYVVFHENTAYISCWGVVTDWTNLTNSYIAKMNLTTREITKIPLPGGPEGMAIVNNKIYVALNYKDSIVVVNLANDQLDYIATPAVTSYFLKDKLNNLYVSLVSTYGHPSTKTGLGYLNTSTHELSVYEKEGISYSYGSIMQFDQDQSKILIVASGWVENDGNWELQGGVESFDIASKTFSTTPFLSGANGINGLTVNPVDGNVYCFFTKGASEAGEMKIYSPQGEWKSTFSTGIDPIMAVFVK
jgi:hypothetical protein